MEIAFSLLLEAKELTKQWRLLYARIPVHFIGRVGADDFGRTLDQTLQAARVQTDGLAIDSSTHSGVASIVVDETGDNTIACAAGANGLVGEEDVERFIQKLDAAKVVLLELGIPLPAIIEAARAARSRNITVILDPAPITEPLPSSLYPLVDIITPNEVEASQLVGFTVRDSSTAGQAAAILHQRGVQRVIVTLASQGCFCSSAKGETFAMPGLRVEVVDTVGAGDAFNGALAAALAFGKSFSLLSNGVLWLGVWQLPNRALNLLYQSLILLSNFYEMLTIDNKSK